MTNFDLSLLSEIEKISKLTDRPKRQNVYEYINTGSFDTPEGLWLMRDTWGNTIARVTSFDAFKGPPPYYGNPKVYVDLFYSRGVRYKKNQLLSCPGSCAYFHIDPPAWWASRSFTDAYAAASK